MTNCLNLGGIWQQISSRNSALRNTTPTGVGWDRMRGCWEKRGRMKVLLGALGFLLTRWTSQCQFDAVVYSVVRHLVIGGGDIWHMASGVGLSGGLVVNGGVSVLAGGPGGSPARRREECGPDRRSETFLSVLSRGGGDQHFRPEGRGFTLWTFIIGRVFILGGSSLVTFCHCCAISDKEQVLSLPFKMWDVW